MTRKPRRRSAPPPAPPPSVHDLVAAPELAAIVLLQHALGVASSALVAEHPTLRNDWHTLREHGLIVLLARAICCREAGLRVLLERYRRAVRDAAGAPASRSDDELF